MATIDQAGNIIDKNFVVNRTLAPAAVGTQVILMTIVSVVTVLVFNVLRPKNKYIYEPKVKYNTGKLPPRINDSIFGWFPPLVHTREPELLDKTGLDAVTFLRFLRLLRYLFTAIALLTCAVLVPINVAYNLAHVPSKARDVLSILTVRDVAGPFLAAHVAVTYAITLLVCGFVHYNWRAMLRLRHAWFRSPEYAQSFYARTLAVRHVPRAHQSDEGLARVFAQLKVPYPTTSVHIGRSAGRLPELVQYHNDTVREFEQVLVTYLRGGRIGPRRPTIRIAGGRRDAIDYYTEKLKRTEAGVHQYRAQIDTRKAENYGFASMAAVPYAHIVARLLRGKNPMGINIELAPNPKDIIWANMAKSDSEILAKKTIGFIWLAVVCFINTVPLAIISVLANLASLTAAVPALDRWSKASPSSFAIVSGVLPPAVQALFGWVLPMIMRWLSRFQGALTHSRLDRAVVARYYFFLVLSQLVIFTLFGVLFNSVKEVASQVGKHQSFGKIIQNLDKLPSIVHKTYIDQASFWLTFFPLRGFLAVFDLAQILNLVWIHIKTRLFGRTPRDIRDWTQPPEFEYAVYYSNLLFMAAVGFVFAPLAPLVALAGAIVFWLSSWVYKYQLMFVFVSKVESGGRLWNVVINRLLASVILMHLLMLLTIGLRFKFHSFIWVSTIPPAFIVLFYKIYINRAFDRHFRYYIPSEEELRKAKVHHHDNKGRRLERRFGHPALHDDLFTPMLHAKMMPLLAEVYHGRISDAQADEEGKGAGEKIVDGITIAAVDARDLEYDPVLYQRDRGELDWDQRSDAVSVVLDAGDAAGGGGGKRASTGDLAAALPGYEQYLATGPLAGAHETNPLLQRNAAASASGLFEQVGLAPAGVVGAQAETQTQTQTQRAVSPAPADPVVRSHSPYYQQTPPGLGEQHRAGQGSGQAYDVGLPTSAASQRQSQYQPHGPGGGGAAGGGQHARQGSSGYPAYDLGRPSSAASQRQSLYQQPQGPAGGGHHARQASSGHPAYDVGRPVSSAASQRQQQQPMGYPPPPLPGQPQQQHPARLQRPHTPGGSGGRSSSGAAAGRGGR